MNNITGCMLKMIYSNSHLFTCENCPIAKYHCCEFNNQNVYSLMLIINLPYEEFNILSIYMVLNVLFY